MSVVADHRPATGATHSAMQHATDEKAARTLYPVAMSRLPTRRLDATRAEDLDDAVRLLRAGRLVAVPTETVYGLAADATQPAAVRAIFTAKGRPSDHPLIVHLPDAGHLTRWARDIPDDAHRLATAFWPGPLTLLLHRAPEADATVAGGRDSIGLRVPAHPVLREVLRRLDGGLAAPSANPYQRLSPTTAAQVLAGLDGRIDAVLDGGPCTVGLESTIVDLTGEVPRIVRAGPVTAADIAAVLGRPVEQPQHHDTAVPGNIAVHYRPHTPLRMFDAAALAARLQALPDTMRVAVAAYGDALPRPTTPGVAAWVAMPTAKPDYARALYATLHALDAAGADEIWLQTPPAGDVWHDVHDRLGRAASG